MMTKILNGIFNATKYLLFIAAFGITIFIVIQMNSRLEKGFMTSINVFIPFFVLLGLFIMYITNPFFLETLEKLPEIWLNILFWVLLIIYVTDTIVSTVVISYIKKALKFIGKELDNTEEITKRIKEVLMQKSPLHRRLANAYPKLETVKLKIKEKKEEIKQQVEGQTREIKKQIKNQKEEIKQQIENQKTEIGKILDKKIKKSENQEKKSN